MTTFASNFDYSDLSHHTEPCLPYFLDVLDAGSDDLDDWWLDLGAVDLSGIPGM